VKEAQHVNCNQVASPCIRNARPLAVKPCGNCVLVLNRLVALFEINERDSHLLRFGIPRRFYKAWKISVTAIERYQRIDPVVVRCGQSLRRQLPILRKIAKSAQPIRCRTVATSVIGKAMCL